MFSRHQIRFLSILAVCLAITNASWFDSIFGKRTPANENRQLISSLVGGLTSDLGGASVGLGATGGSSSSTPASTTGSGTQSSTSSSSTPSSTSASSTSQSSSSSVQQTSSSSSTSDSSSSSSQSVAVQTTTPTPTSQSAVVVTVVKTTDGSTYLSTSTSTSPPSTSSTSSASLSQSQSQSSGLTAKTKNTVIGVVVGVGGAIILAGLFVVVWRIWGRSKKEDEGDGLMGFRGGSSGHEKSGSVSAAGTANPFQSTLENYHNPATVNASSNF